MGNNFSTNKLSYDGVWASVSTWHDINSIQEQEWDKLNEKIFEGLNDEDMLKITAIMGLKKASGKNREYWIINTDIIRILDVFWHSKSRQYSWEGVSNPDGNYGWRKIKGQAFHMKRLAIHVAALEDFKAMKKGDSDGTVFKKISSEQLQIRKNPDNE